MNRIAMVDPMRLNIGFVSTRFAGIDGVSLESSKWARVLENEGHTCFWFAGELSKSEHISLQVGQANFKDDQNQWINRQLFGTHQKSLRLARIMCDYKSTIASADAYEIGVAAVELGAGRRRIEDEVDPAVGLELLARLGDPVQRGQPLAEIHARSADAAESMIRRLGRAFDFGEAPPEDAPLVWRRVPEGQTGS